jgi:hypothetical protein
MVTFTADEKLSAVQRYLDGVRSYESIAGCNTSAAVQEHVENPIQVFRRSLNSKMENTVPFTRNRRAIKEKGASNHEEGKQERNTR